MLQVDLITETYSGVEMSKERPLIQFMEDVNPDAYSEEVTAYFAYYNLDCDPAVTHFFGSFSSGDYTLAAHLYRPVHYEATLILLHGYLNHTGQFKQLIPYLLDQGYAVAAFDLPGHGLSSGQSARIENFDEYVQSLNDFLKIVQPHLHGPYHALGFSTGASILVDVLLHNQAELLDKMILAAPLIHWAGYHQSKNTYKIYIKFTNKVPRILRKNSSDKEYRKFNKTKDYLHATHISLDWIKALFEWNELIMDLPACDKKVLILQGDKDTTVDWKYNLKLLGNKFPNSTIRMFPMARHELFNETQEHRQKALESVSKFLQQ